MFKPIKTALLLSLLLPTISHLAVADSKTITACGHHDYPPWNWKSDNKIIGACAAVTEGLLARLGYQVDLQYVGPWKRCQHLVKTGQVDINICSFINEERQKYSEFIHTPMGVNENAVFVKNTNTFEFSSWDDLKNKRAGLVLGVSIGQKFDDFVKEEKNVTNLVDYASGFKMLNKGRLDYIPFGKFSGLAELEAMGLSDKIVPLPTPLLAGNLYISMSKKSRYLHLLPEMEKMMQEPTYSMWVENLLNEYTHRYAEEQK